MTLRRKLTGLVCLGLLLTGAAVAIILTSGHRSDRGAYAAVGSGIAWSFISAGAYAWWRRPENRTGALMVWVGFAWLVSPLDFSDTPLLFILGEFTGPLPIAALTHLILAFPAGRIDSRYHRRLVAFAYFAATLLQLPGILFWDTANSSTCDNCPSNPFLISASEDVRNAGAAVVNLCAIVVIVLIAREVVRRIRRAKGTEREAYGPVVYASVATLASFVLLFVSGGIGGNEARVFQLLAFVTFATVPYAFMGGLIRGRLSRAGAISALVESLGRTDDRRQSLRAAIADALGDSSLQLAYWIPAQQAYVDATGQRVELPAPGSGRVATPIERNDELLAAVVHDESLTDERDLVAAVGGAAALTLENERLAAELRAHIEELRSSRARIVQAADDERRRLERDLHDGAQQRLVALALNLKFARTSFEDDPDGARTLLDDAIEELTAATAELRELARGIHPAILTDRGLDAAVHALAGRATVPVEVGAVPTERLSPPVESTAYFVVAEALTNVARYSQASFAAVDIERENGTLVVEVRDDGIGGADPAHGSGLRGLSDRVASVDGRLVVTSEPGSGTIVHAEIPCGQ